MEREPNIRTIIGEIIIILIVVIFTGNNNLFSRFLLLDEAKDEKSKTGKVLPSYIARNIVAKHHEDMKGVVKITWDVEPSVAEDFIVGRYNSVINTKKKALSADIVEIIASGAKNEVIDFTNRTGTFYYVVLASEKSKSQEIELFRDENYTSTPVIIDEKDVYYHVKGIKAKQVDDNSVELKWKKIPKGGIYYTIYRSTRRLDEARKLKTADKVWEIADNGEYKDTGVVVPGIYYYAVTARFKKDPERYFPYRDHNYTMIGIRLAGKEDLAENKVYKMQSINANRLKKGIGIEWTFTGSMGGKYFRLFRTEKWVTDVEQLNEDSFIDDVDINTRKYYDPNVRSGKYYYGLLPYGYNTRKIILSRGVNITSRSVSMKGTKVAVDKKKDKIVVPFDNDFKDDTEEVDNDIDSILRKTYFKGKYSRAINALRKAAPLTESEEYRAKALLFIGRSYVELGKYNRALNYFIQKDVEKYFPEESRFWHDYTVVRIK